MLEEFPARAEVNQHTNSGNKKAVNFRKDKVEWEKT